MTTTGLGVVLTLLLTSQVNGHLRYHNNLDKSLNDTTADKIRKYCADYNNTPLNVVSLMSVITSTSGRLHSEFIRLLFLQTRRETAARHTLLSSSQNVEIYSLRLWFNVLILTLTGSLSHLNLTLTLHTRKLLVYN